jgi:3-hydroxyisobutyrate dehydrogenase
MKESRIDPADANIGWIGTGIMGAPMAMHLVKAGYNVSVYTRTKSRAVKLTDSGCTWYESPASLAENCDIIFSIVGYPVDVEEVYFGEKGLLKSLRKGSVIIDMTTTLPALSARIAEACRKAGAHAIDAPVSGGEVGAIKGSLSVMIGGEKEVVEQIEPLMEAFSGNMVYQGSAGAGQHTKMCNQITLAGTMIGVCEALIYGFKAGLDLDTMLSSISKGAAACWSLDVLAPRIVRGDFEPGFLVEHFVKDLGIALNEAGRMNLSLPGLGLAGKLYQELVEMGKGNKGTQALYLALEKLSGLSGTMQGD